MTFIDDNGNQLEFGGEFAMTKQAVSFFNGSIKGDVSINFTIENNSVNRKVLNYYGAQMTSQVAFTKQAFNRVRNGNVIDRGYIVIQGEEGDSLSCFYVSGNSNWIQLLQGLITELDYTGVLSSKNYSTLISSTSVTGLRTATDGIIFPLVDWAYDLRKGDNQTFMFGTSRKFKDSTNDIDKSFMDFYPCLYLSSVVTEIANQNGIKIAGNVLNEPVYKSLIITPASGLMKRIPINNTVSIGWTGSLGNNFTMSGGYNKYNLWSSYGSEIADPENLFDLANNRYIASRNSVLRFTITAIDYVQITVPPSPSDSQPRTISLYKNGVLIDEELVYYNIGIAGRVIVLESSAAIGDIFEIYVDTDTINGGIVYLPLSLKVEIPEVIGVLDYVEPSQFLPSLKSLDVVKFLINYFGCVAYYNEYSKTITINTIESIKPESSLDWSEYYLSHRSEYTVDQAKNNYIKWSTSGIDPFVKKYNEINDLNFADGNITTGNTLKAQNNLFSLPFTPTYSDRNDKNDFYLANVPLVNLTVASDPIAFSAISYFAATTSTFTLTDAAVIDTGEIISIQDSSGYDYGYFYVLSGVPFLSTGSRIINWVFTKSFAGTIKKHNINYKNVGARILSVIPNETISRFSGGTNIILHYNDGAGYNDTTETAIAYATFTKPIISDTLDQWKNNLAIDNPDLTGYTDPTIKQLYFNKITKFLQNPDVRCRMLLPEAVYQSFVFDQFIYLKTERLTGYFFVESIVNYVDGNTPVEVNLFML